LINGACEASGMASEALANAIDDPALASELRESLSEFESYRIDQRPAFIRKRLTNLRPNLELTGCFSLLLLFLSGAPQQTS
jgi:hypothetical protein